MKKGWEQKSVNPGSHGHHLPGVKPYSPWGLPRCSLLLSLWALKSCSPKGLFWVAHSRFFPQKLNWELTSSRKPALVTYKSLVMLCAPIRVFKLKCVPNIVHVLIFSPHKNPMRFSGWRPHNYYAETGSEPRESGSRALDLMLFVLHVHKSLP